MKNKISRLLLIFLSIVLIIGALYELANYGGYLFGGKAKDVYEIILEDSFDEYEGKYVSLNVDAVIENYAETTHTYNFIPVGKDQHYIAWLVDDSLISVSVKGGSKSKKMDTIADETWDYLNGVTEDFTQEPLKVEGVLKDLKGELANYYDQIIDEYEMRDFFEIRYLNIDATQTRFTEIAIILFLLVLGSALFYVGITGGNKKDIPTTDFINEEKNREEEVDNNPVE